MNFRLSIPLSLLALLGYQCAASAVALFPGDSITFTENIFQVNASGLPAGSGPFGAYDGYPVLASGEQPGFPGGTGLSGSDFLMGNTFETATLDDGGTPLDPTDDNRVLNFPLNDIGTALQSGQTPGTGAGAYSSNRLDDATADQAEPISGLPSGGKLLV